MDTSGTTLIGLGLLAFFALLLIGGLVLVGALGVMAYRSFRQKQGEGTDRTGLDERQGCIAAVLLGALLAFLGGLGLTALLAFMLLTTVTGAAGVVQTLSDEEPAPVHVFVAPDEGPSRTRLLAEVRGSLDPELVQRLSDIATRRRELDLRVRSRQGKDGETWIYEFVLPPADLDPDALQREMRRELEGTGLVPVGLTTEEFSD